MCSSRTWPEPCENPSTPALLPSPDRTEKARKTQIFNQQHMHLLYRQRTISRSALPSPKLVCISNALVGTLDVANVFHPHIAGVLVNLERPPKVDSRIIRNSCMLRRIYRQRRLLQRVPRAEDAREENGEPLGARTSASAVWGHDKTAGVDDRS
jgi:hypothetical protein